MPITFKDDSYTCSCGCCRQESFTARLKGYEMLGHIEGWGDTKAEALQSLIGHVDETAEELDRLRVEITAALKELSG